MSSQNLTNANVQFSVTGVEAVKAAMDKVQQQLQSITQGVNTVGPLINNVLGMARGHLEGFVRAGVGASTAGFVLRFQLERISREMASLFLPAIRQVVEYTRQFADWLSRLSGAQQQNLARWITAGAAVLGVAVVLPRVIAGVQGLVLGIRALAVAVAGLEASTGLGALLPLLGGLATALTALAVGTEVGTKGLGKLWGSIQPLVDGLGQLVAQVFETMNPILDQLSGLFQVVAQGLLSLLPTIQQTVLTLGEGLGSAVSGFLAGLIPALEAAMAAVGGIVTTVSGMAGGMEALFEAIGSGLHALGQIGAVLIPLLMAPLRAVLAVAVILINVLTPVLKGLAVVLEAVAFVLDLVNQGFAWLGRVANMVVAPIRQALAPLAEALGQVWQAFADLQDAVRELMAGLGDSLSPALKELGDLLAGIVTGLARPFIDFVAGLARLITTVLVPALKQLLGWLKEVTGWVRGLTGKGIAVKAGKDDSPHQRLQRQAGGIEAIDQTWRRIAEASVKSTLGKSEPEKHTELLDEIAKNTANTRSSVDRIKPTIA